MSFWEIFEEAVPALYNICRWFPREIPSTAEIEDPELGTTLVWRRILQRQLCQHLDDRFDSRRRAGHVHTLDRATKCLANLARNRHALVHSRVRASSLRTSHPLQESLGY